MELPCRPNCRPGSRAWVTSAAPICRRWRGKRSRGWSTYADWFLRDVDKGLADVERGQTLSPAKVGARVEKRLAGTAC